MYSGLTLHVLQSFKAGSLGSETFTENILHGAWSTHMLVMFDRPK